MAFLPSPGERAILFGQSGSGKSIAAAWMLHYMPAPIVIYDTKVSPSLVRCFPGADIVDGLTGARIALRKPVTILRPSPEELSDPEFLDDALWRLYLRKVPMTLYLDEALDLHVAGRAGRGLLACVSRGREQGITLMIATQRPAWVSLYLLSEAQHYYVFKLRLKADKDRVEQITGFRLRPLDKHHFVHIDNDDAPTYYSPVPMSVPVRERNRLAGLAEPGSSPG